MHRVVIFSRIMLPVLSLALLIGHVKFGVTPFGFSSGRV